MPKYRYSSIDSDAGQIRLATLLPSPTFDSDIQIVLDTEILSTGSVPEYEALSYVWGTTQNPATVDIGGSRLTVTRSLREALPYLRHRDKPRTLWIDAICVNQDNLQERSRQVEKMTALYTEAKRVIVWLGPESGESDLAFRSMESWSAKISYDIEKDLAFPAIESGLPWTAQDPTMPYDEDAIRSVTSVLKREWFNRLWIFQEIRLANDQAIIQAGHKYIRWTDFRACCYYLRRKFEGNKADNLLYSHFTQYYLRLQPLGLGSPQVFEDLQRLTWDTRHTKCTDPRDRIYAILSLVHKSNAIGLRPDYTKSIGEVYQDVVLHILKSCRSLRILARCEMDGNKTANTRIPSWTPNFAVPSRYRLPLRDMNATADSLAHARSLGSGVLGVTGVHITKVASIHSLTRASISRDAALKLMQDLVAMRPKATAGNPDSGRDEESILAAYCRTFNRNLFLDHWLPPKGHYPTFPQGRRALDDVLNWREDKGPEGFSDATLRYIENFRALAVGRAFFITEDGNVGLAPTSVRVGDVLVAMLGVDSVMTLRDAGNGQFMVVGEAYLDAFTTVEAILGKFEGGWVRMSRFDEESKAYWQAYFNILTKDIQVADPRLGPLPEGWKTQEHKEQGLWSWYVREDDLAIEKQSEYERWRSDPRLRPDYLKQRGVPMVEFILV